MVEDCCCCSWWWCCCFAMTGDEVRFAAAEERAEDCGPHCWHCCIYLPGSEDGMCIGSMSCSERNLDGSLLRDVKLKRGSLIELVLEREPSSVRVRDGH